MKQIAAIIFSLLLIVAQTFAVGSRVNGGALVAATDCCCDRCGCIQSAETSSVPVAPSTVPVAAQSQFALPPAAAVLFTLSAPTDKISPASLFSEFRAAQLPIFQRNCSLLI